MEVHIKIKSSQTDAVGEKTHVNMEADGCLSCKNGKLYLRYEDMALLQGERVSTTVKLLENGMLLLRKGALQQRMEFLEECETVSMYRTSCGVLELRIRTTCFAKELSEESGGFVRLRYELYANGKWQSRNRLEMEVLPVVGRQLC